MDEDEWNRVRLKFYAAKNRWPVRAHQTPRGAKQIEAGGAGQTWAEWFEARHGESLFAYRQRVRSEGLRERILEYELARYGRSTLEETTTEGA